MKERFQVKKRFTALILALSMAMGAVALAAGTEKTISVTPMELTINGQTVTPTKSNGEAAEVFAYDGATYVPLRYLSELMGLQVEWDKTSPSVAGLVNVPNFTAAGGDGVYTAVTQGFGGDVTVTVTVTGGKVTACEILGEKETPSIGGAALETLKGQILTTGSAQIDGVAGATMTSGAVKTAVQKCLDEAAGKASLKANRYTPGTYSATAKGHKGQVTMETTFDETSITDVKVKEISETYGLAWGLTTSPAEVLPGQILASQSLAVDTITGATVTCRAIVTAVAECVTAAGGDPELLKNVPVEKPAPQDQILEADVVVVGAGAAGLCAAVSAMENGARVVVLEKQGITGGATARSGGKIVAAGTKWQEAQGIHDTPDMMMDFFRSVGEGMLNEKLLRNYSDNAAELMYWMEDRGVKFQDVEAIQGSIETWRVHNPAGGGGQVSGGSGNGAQITTPLTGAAEKAGAQFVYNCRAEELLVDGKNTVVGVKGTQKDGSTVTVNAKSVILCTGGYASNREKMAIYDECSKGYSTLVPAGNVGDGLAMATAIGAKEEVSPATQVIYISMTCGLGIKEEAGLIVNARGERVVNEYTYQYHVGQGIAQSGCSYGYYIASAADPNKSAQFGMTLDSTPHAPTAAELAEKIGVDPAVLQATVDRYNVLCAKGEDEDFGKPAHKMIPVEGELYAFRLDPSVTVTYGGLVIDEDARVLDTNDKPITGLYAAGEVAFSGLCGREYPSCGLAVGTAAYFGKVAGETAARAK